MSGWFDKIFGPASSDYHRYDEGDQYPRYDNIPRQTSDSGWHGPNIFEDPRGSGGGSSYSNDRPSSSYAYAPYYDDRTSYNDDERSSYNTNDRPTYNNERVSHDHGTFSTEETDRAIALALYEEEQRRGGVSRDMDSDEELARAMQESLDLQYRAPQRLPDYSPIFRPPVPRLNKPSICAGCNESLGYGRFLSCLGKTWHPNCFSCKLCNKPIADREFSVQGTEAYHRDCHKELFHPKCEVCNNYIPTNAEGLIEYRSHPFWNQKYCPSHETDGTPRCCSCDRIETGGPGQYATLEDGRKLCLVCLETTVVDTKDCQPLYREILKFYKNLGMMIDQEIPMLLVARSALNEAREGEKEGHVHTSETRGLCLSEEQTITTVFGGKPRFPMMAPSRMWTEPQKLVRHCEVTAVLVLYGLPRLLTGSILAHELMHAWLRLAGGFPHLRPEVEEGIAQVMSHIWLSAELKRASLGKSSYSGKGLSSPEQRRLGEFFLHQIATDSSPIYGGGFREGIAAVQQFGLVRVLEHLKLTGSFP